MARIFVYDGRTFPDPDPKMSTDQVRQSFANLIPELANAEILKTVKRGEDEVIEFKRRTGTKGGEEPCTDCQHDVVCPGCPEKSYTPPRKVLCPVCDREMKRLGEIYGCDCGITIIINHPPA